MVELKERGNLQCQEEQEDSIKGDGRMNDFKYKVSIKMKYKLFFSIFSVASLLFLVVIIIHSIKTCTTYLDYIVAILVALCCVACTYFGIYQNVKSVEVYKGKIVYKTLFFKKDYRPLEIYCAKTKVIETDGYLSYIEGGTKNCGTWDEVTTFYDKCGNKLFAFGKAYDNVSILEKSILNNQKSVHHTKNKQ